MNKRKVSADEAKRISNEVRAGSIERRRSQPAPKKAKDDNKQCHVAIEGAHGVDPCGTCLLLQ